MITKPTGQKEGPYEILLYHGRRGRLPDPFDYERIGATEVGSVSWLVASGDWDNSGTIDLAVAYRIIGDTSYGDVGANYDINSFVVFWGDSAGHYSVLDTTRLENSYQMWFGPGGTFLSFDANKDGYEDLVTLGQAGFSDGRVHALPRMLIWYGHDHRKWGRDGVGRLYDWSWWGAPVFDKVIDADGDGVLDLCGVEYSPGGHYRLANAFVLYGTSAPMLDSTAVVRIMLDSSGSETAVFSDVTGDHIPELVTLSGGERQNSIKVFVGLRGQRLDEQYGTGHEPPHPGQPRWWGKPWAEVWQPYRVNDVWTRNDYLYDFGDASGNGIGNIWSFSWPYLLIYNTGEQMDSLIDAMVRYNSGDIFLGAHAVLGDIDGSGLSTFAFGNGSRLFFYKADRTLQNMTYVGRLLPPGTGPATIPQVFEQDTALALRVVPNPAHGVVNLHWPVAGLTGTARITLTDTQGRAVGELTADAASGSRTFSTSDLSPGEYFVTVSAAGRRATARFVVMPR